MRLLFVTDLHGSRRKYECLLEAAEDFRADVVINGGDMLPKNNLFGQDRFVTDYLDRHFSQFDSAGIHYLCYPGNDDLMIFDRLFEETCGKYKFVVCLAQRRIEIGGIEFIGMNWVVDYPFRLKDRCRMDTDDYVFQEQLGTGLLSTPGGWRELEDWPAYARKLPTIEEELRRMVRPVKPDSAVYVIHMPPSRLGLDTCYRDGEVGSTAVYNFLKARQPRLSLHGHIHESPDCTGKWLATLGRTTCLQPGQLNECTYVTIDLAAMKFERITR